MMETQKEIPTQEAAPLGVNAQLLVMWNRDGWKIRDVQGHVIARTCPWDESGCRKEDHVAANLITAAPSLYEVLKYAVECFVGGCPPSEKWLEQARSALDIAEGNF